MVTPVRMSALTIGWVIQTTMPRVAAGGVNDRVVGLEVPVPSLELPQAAAALIALSLEASSFDPGAPWGSVRSVLQATAPRIRPPINLVLCNALSGEESRGKRRQTWSSNRQGGGPNRPEVPRIAAVMRSSQRL